MASMKCTGCGADVPNQSAKCPKCGYPIDLDRSRASSAPLSHTYFTLPEKIEPKRFSIKRVFFAVILILIPCGLIAAVFFRSIQKPARSNFPEKTTNDNRSPVQTPSSTVLIVQKQNPKTSPSVPKQTQPQPPALQGGTVPSDTPQNIQEPAITSQPNIRDITEQSNVALLCHYSDGKESRGSGVIVNPQGYILTAKHMVDPLWASWAAGKAPDNATLNNCEVGIPPIANLPTLQQIQTFNPGIKVLPPFPFIATLSFEPTQEKMSDNEYEHLDFAILKIVKPSTNCNLNDLCALPTAFPYNPVDYTDFPPDNTFLFNFGYPYEVSTLNGDNFSIYSLKGAVGTLTQTQGGDNYFINKPLNFTWSAIDVISGRSGSPLYWNGYVVGIEYAGEVENSAHDVAVSMPAIHQVLNDNGLGNFLSVN